jgi:hypothetical protein
VSAERFLNSYHNASTPIGPDVPAELAAFMLAVDPVLVQAAELARVLTRAHQGAATQLIGEDWTHARKYFSLSEKYAAWADYRQPAVGYGIHAYAHKGRPADPADRRRAQEASGVEELRYPEGQPSSDAGMAGRSADRLRRAELWVHPGFGPPVGGLHRTG